MWEIFTLNININYVILLNIIYVIKENLKLILLICF